MKVPARCMTSAPWEYPTRTNFWPGHCCDLLERWVMVSLTPMDLESQVEVAGYYCNGFVKRAKELGNGCEIYIDGIASYSGY